MSEQPTEEHEPDSIEETLQNFLEKETNRQPGEKNIRTELLSGILHSYKLTKQPDKNLANNYYNDFMHKLSEVQIFVKLNNWAWPFDEEEKPVIKEIINGIEETIFPKKEEYTKEEETIELSSLWDDFLDKLDYGD